MLKYFELAIIVVLTNIIIHFLIQLKNPPPLGVVMSFSALP